MKSLSQPGYSDADNLAVSSALTGLGALAGVVYTMWPNPVQRVSDHNPVQRVPNPPRIPLLKRSHKSIKRERVMYQVGKVQNNVGGKLVIHTFHKKNSGDREVKQAFRLYRPVTFSQWTYNNYSMAVGDSTVAADLTNGVSGTLTTTKTNACLNAHFGFLNSGTNWNAGPNNNVMGLNDPGTFGGASGIATPLLSQAYATGPMSSAVIGGSTSGGVVNPGDLNFRYLLGPSTHTVLLENMAPYMTDVEVYVLTPKYSDVLPPIGTFTLGPALDGTGVSETFFPRENIDIFETKPTDFRFFNESYKVLSKKSVRLAAGANIELVVKSKGWQKLTFTMLNRLNPQMPYRTFYIYIRAKGPSGYIHDAGIPNPNVGGIANIPVKLGYRIKETVSVLPCPYSVMKKARLRTQLEDFVSLDNVQYFNAASGQPTSLTAALAATSSYVGVPNV